MEKHQVAVKAVQVAEDLLELYAKRSTIRRIQLTAPDTLAA
jgi:hypothetical protein